jgi:hypothetical protein
VALHQGGRAQQRAKERCPPSAANAHLPRSADGVEGDYLAAVVGDDGAEATKVHAAFGGHSSTQTIGQRVRLPGYFFDHVVIEAALFYEGNVADYGFEGDRLLLLLHVANRKHFIATLDLRPLPVFQDNGGAGDVHERSCVAAKTEKLRDNVRCASRAQHLAMWNDDSPTPRMRGEPIRAANKVPPSSPDTMAMPYVPTI